MNERIVEVTFETNQQKITTSFPASCTNEAAILFAGIFPDIGVFAAKIDGHTAFYLAAGSQAFGLPGLHDWPKPVEMYEAAK